MMRSCERSSRRFSKSFTPDHCGCSPSRSLRRPLRIRLPTSRPPLPRSTPVASPPPSPRSNRWGSACPCWAITSLGILHRPSSNRKIMLRFRNRSNRFGDRLRPRRSPREPFCWPRAPLDKTEKPHKPSTSCARITRRSLSRQATSPWRTLLRLRAIPSALQFTLSASTTASQSPPNPRKPKLKW